MNEADYYEEQEASKNAIYLDDKQLLSQFLLTPTIDDEADYRHIDKNLSITRLASRYREPEQARSILQGLHVLNNPKYFYEKTIKEIIGYDDKEEEINGRKVFRRVPVYREIVVNKSYYPKLFHILKAKFRSLVVTSSSRDGHLIRTVGTRRIERSESIEDKTTNKPNWFGFGGQNQKNREKEY